MFVVDRFSIEDGNLSQFMATHGLEIKFSYDLSSCTCFVIEEQCHLMNC